MSGRFCVGYRKLTLSLTVCLVEVDQRFKPKRSVFQIVVFFVVLFYLLICLSLFRIEKSRVVYYILQFSGKVSRGKSEVFYLCFLQMSGENP